jgi:hypothetical protein
LVQAAALFAVPHFGHWLNPFGKRYFPSDTIIPGA